ncbi:MAG: C25 family cysteine peptidase, partial [Salinivirgaceae bacterium]
MKQLFLTLLIAAIFVSGNAQNFIVTETGKLTNDERVFQMPERTSAKATTDAYTASFTFPSVKIIEKSRKSETYQFLKILGTGQTTQAGAPALPSFYDQVLAPKNSQAQITINKTTYTELNGFMLHPALQPAKDTYGAAPPEWEMDETVYSTNKFYPENPVSIHTTQDLRGFPIVMVQVNPVQFNPVTGQIRVHSELSYTVHFNNGDKSSINALATGHSPTFLTNLRAGITNPQVVPTASKAKSKTGEYNYLLITPNAYKAAADTLAQWKRQLGYTVEVIAEQAWSAAMVKDAIHSRYSEWTVKPDYFLILGDHGGNNPVPGEMFPAPDNEGYYATDLYFACMGGSSDFRPEMAHGRISVSTPTEAMNVVKKIVNYERNPVNNADFYEKGLTCAQFQDVADNEAPDGYAARRFAHTSEDIRDYTISQGYDVDRIYYTDNTNTPTNYNSGYYSNGQAIPSELLRSNGFAWNGNSNHIKEAINDGRLFVFHRDHGYAGGTGWSNPNFVTSSISSLANGEMLPIVFSINCHTGEFSLPKCFSEAFLRHEGGGAVGVFGASYYSYSGYNDGLSAGMIDAIWSNPGLTPNFGYGGAYNPPASTANNIRTMGDVMNQGLVRMEQTWGV